ncbi:heme exporter protein CcmD [Vibrio sp. HB236076]|uniref:Heme exporter protein D n=2 Tax=unclassified Vibrio TaxID=2614977 RepID=A0AB39HH83_9VIBR
MMLQSLFEWAAMGGYGFYVWGSLSVTVTAMLCCVFSLHCRHHALLKKRQQRQNNENL